MENVKEFSNEKLIEIYKECNYSLLKIEKTYGLGKNAASRLFKSRKIDYNKIKEENYKSPEDLYYENPKCCKHCGKMIPYEKRYNEFCNLSCSASFNNQGIIRNGMPLKDTFCLNCGKLIRTPNKYCSRECQHEYLHNEYIRKWQSGEIDGRSGKYDISSHIRRFLFDQYNCSCQLCGWNKINLFTGKVPLQIHHINPSEKLFTLDTRTIERMSDDEVIKEFNKCKLLCSNCHAELHNPDYILDNYQKFRELSSGIKRRVNHELSLLDVGE